MCFFYGRLNLLIVLSLLIVKIDTKFEFTNLKCKTLDDDFAKFEHCFLKSVNRTYKYASMKVNLLRLPIKEFLVNVAMFKRLNGYKPFLYNFTLDGCKFLGSRKSKNPVATYFYDFIAPFSNMNHSCPYNHDLIVEKLTIDFMDYRLTKMLPFPEGNYMVDTTWASNGKSRANVQIFGTIS